MTSSIRKTTFLLAFLLSAALSFAQGSGSGDIKVSVTDEKNQPMPGAIVHITAGGPNIGGQTDMDGVYTFRGLSPGTYSIEARMLGYKKYLKTGIIVNSGQTTYPSFPMELSMCDTCVIEVVFQAGPIDKNYSTLHNISADEVKHMPVQKGDVIGMVTGTCSSCSQGSSGGLVMRGAREGASSIYVDGEQLYGSQAVIGQSVQQVTILSGGIPAEYGDLTGGAVIITTKSYYTGLAAKQSMYQDAADKKQAQQKADDAKSGKRVETNDQIIDKDDQNNQNNNQNNNGNNNNGNNSQDKKQADPPKK
ncbi:MAG TPA: carboxypeptidase regulatory-like domain-containing protein [Bacteroidia bacterium]|nr:carboxypeptidase regulatory-like domain-containing protein [Bacteroidia bacterium]